MSGIERYCVTLEKQVVLQAKEQLEIGQSLSPVINELLKEWIKNKVEAND